MCMVFYDYKFKTNKYRDSWRCILNNTFENMELYHRKQFSMQRLLSIFKKAFNITPITLKNSTDNDLYRYKLLAIYLLTKYSKEDFEVIAQEFHITPKIVTLISSRNYATIFQDDIKLFFKQFENDYTSARKEALAWQETLDNIDLDS